ncbi:pilus assembly protein [Pseudonocardiaceae bacterium YIM PH 21723]|nr:pilus assembly protein [Pseudonocardiaceae bacterium YIM PH 21723]
MKQLEDDEGAVTVEVAVWLLPIVILGLLLWAFGRLELAHSAVQHVTISAARQASIARTPGEARTQATAVAQRVLAEQHARCSSTSVTVDTSGFSAPPGQPATVRVEVTCVLDVSDLISVPGLPGSKTITDSFSSPLDPYRGRSG